MIEEPHDWWSHLTPFEKASVRLHEKESDRKHALVADMQKRRTSRGKPGCLKLIVRMELEIAGHKQMVYRYQNRGLQRAKGGHKPKLGKLDRKITHIDGAMT